MKFRISICVLFLTALATYAPATQGEPPGLTLTRERTSPFSRVTLVLARDPSGLRTFSVSTRMLESFNSKLAAVAEADAHAAVRSGCELVSDLKGGALDCRNRLPGSLDRDGAVDRADRAG